METFYTIQNDEIVQLTGEVIKTKRRQTLYRVEGQQIMGWKTKTAVRVARSDKRAQELCKRAHSKVPALRVRDMKRLKPQGCHRFVDWCKWIIMYDGIPSFADKLEFHRVDEYYTQFLNGTLRDHYNKRQADQIPEPPSKKRRRLYRIICDASEEELDTLLQRM